MITSHDVGLPVDGENWTGVRMCTALRTSVFSHRIQPEGMVRIPKPAGPEWTPTPARENAAMLRKEPLLCCAACRNVRLPRQALAERKRHSVMQTLIRARRAQYGNLQKLAVVIHVDPRVSPLED